MTEGEWVLIAILLWIAMSFLAVYAQHGALLMLAGLFGLFFALELYPKAVQPAGYQDYLSLILAFFAIMEMVVGALAMYDESR